MSISVGSFSGWRSVLLLGLVLGIFGGSAAGMSGPSAAIPSSWASEDPVAPLGRAAAAVARLVPGMEEIWPGFWPEDQPFMIYLPGEAALLVTPAAPPAGFEPVDEHLVPAELRGRAYLYRGTLPGLEAGFRTDYPAGERSAVAVTFDPAGLQETLTTLFHEAFHAYQHQRFSGESSPAGAFVDPEQIAAPEFVALGEVERRMLAEALNLPAIELEDHLRQYLAVRWIRMGSVPAEVVDVERELERKEGSAHLVGLQAGLLATGGDLADLAGALRPYLLFPLENMSGGLSERLIRWRVYGTGAAIGHLLDRLGMEWRHRLEQGATFDELLQEAVAFDPADGAALAPQALGRFGYEELLAQGVGGTGSRSITSLEEFYSLAPVRLTWDVAVRVQDGQVQMDVHFRDGTAGFAQLAPNLFAVPDPEVFTLEAPAGSLEVRGHPVLQDARGLADRVLRITVLLPSLPAINGQVEAPLGEHRLEHLRVEGDGLRLVVGAPVSVRVSSQEVLIAAAERAGDAPGHQ